MEMACCAHQISPVSKILICVGLMLVVFSQLQIIMNVSVMKVLLEMEMCVKVSPQSVQLVRTLYIVQCDH
jgi:hypothetical protein